MSVGWAVPANDRFLDGTWRVGPDIKPGIYRTIPPSQSPGGIPGCYWARLSGLSGERSEIIVNRTSENPVQGRDQGQRRSFQVHRVRRVEQG